MLAAIACANRARRRAATRPPRSSAQAPDAQLVDTTGLSLEEVEEIVLRLVRARVSNGKAATG